MISKKKKKNSGEFMNNDEKDLNLHRSSSSSFGGRSPKQTSKFHVNLSGNHQLVQGIRGHDRSCV